MAAVQQTLTLSNGVALNIEMSGPSGNPIVLLHGFTGDASTMAVLAGPLAVDRTVIVPNLIGHGGSTGPESSYTVDAMAEQLVQLLDQLRADHTIAPAEPVDMVGYSMGGRVALALACFAPEQLRSLALIGSSAGLADEDERAVRAEADDQLAESILTDGLDAFVGRWMANPLFVTQSRLGREALAAFRAQRMNGDAAEFARSLRGATTGRMRPLHEELPKCGVPVRLIAGAHDPKFCAIAVDLAAVLPYAEVSVIDDAGHAAHLEQPAIVIAAIQAGQAESHTVRVELPLVDPMTTAKGVTTRRASALVRVQSRDHVGWGDASPLPGWSQESLDECIAAIATLPTQDMASAASAAVLGAADDLAAREAELPLFAYLAERNQKDVPDRPEIEINGLISAPEPELVAAEAAALVRLGYSTIKLKVAAGANDLARVSALRDAAPEVVLRIDANGGWDIATAATELAALAEFNISLCEEPVSGVDAIADLGREVAIPLAVDESMQGSEGLAQVFGRAEDLGGAVLKPQAIGGPLATLFAIETLQLTGLTIVVTSMIDNAVGLAHAAHIAAAAQLPGAHGLGTARLLARDVAPAHEALPIFDGRMRFAALDDPERWGYGLGLGLVSPGPVGAS